MDYLDLFPDSRRNLKNHQAPFYDNQAALSLLKLWILYVLEPPFQTEEPIWILAREPILTKSSSLLETLQFP